MDLAQELKKKLQPVLDAYTAAKADGKITFWEAMGLVRQICSQAVDLAELAGNVSGADKKAAVDQVLLMAFDALWPMVVLPGWASVLKFLPASFARNLFIAIADQLIELAVSYLPKKDNSDPHLDPITPVS